MQYSSNVKAFIILLIGVFCATQCDVQKKEKITEKSPASGLNQKNLSQKSSVQKPEISSIDRLKFPVDSIMGLWTVDPKVHMRILK